MEEYLKEVYLTEREVAAITKDALSTLRNNRHVGRGFPYIKRNRSVRYRLSDVIASMEGSRVDPAEGK
jgi:hypothetical protein